MKIFVKKENDMEKNIEKHCAVCGHTYLADIYDQGECPNCGWYNSYKIDNMPNRVVYPNLISLNKAKQLFKEGKSFEPNIDDILSGLYFYSEMEFWFKGINFNLFLDDDNGIEFSWGPKPYETIYFKDREDFINNAKIGDKYLKDIWDQVEDPNYM